MRELPFVAFIYSSVLALLLAQPLFAQTSTIQHAQDAGVISSNYLDIRVAF